MAIEAFGFKPAAIPTAVRGLRTSKYGATVEAVYEYLRSHKDQPSVKIDLGDASLKAAVASFRTAIAKRYPGSLRLVQRGGELYIQRRG
jgi:hypothetical protein